MLFVFDIQHPVDANFFRSAIARLRADGHQILLVVLRRGSVRQIVRHEYPDIEAVDVGRHVSFLPGLILRTGLWRELELVRALRGRQVAAALGFPGFQTAIVGKLLGFKSVGAYDDPEHRPNFVLSRFWLDRFVLPECLGEAGARIVSFRALKEWAYLAPRHFTPDPAVLNRHSLAPREYVFIREVESRSLNYRSQREQIIEALYDAGLSAERVVLSLEDKRRRGLFAKWTVLEEPAAVHSLMYYSRLVVSNGDSMAREGAQLGVPSAYCGKRQMKANDALYELGLMRHVTDLEPLLETCRRARVSETEQRRTRDRLTELWEDPTDILMRALRDVVRL
jgi:predicted glycosyltransferase